MVERETGLGGGVSGEPGCTGVNCTNENSNLRLLSGPGKGPEGTDARRPCSFVTRQSAGVDANDPVLARLAALREHWQHARDHKMMRRGLLDLLQVLEEW